MLHRRSCGSLRHGQRRRPTAPSQANLPDAGVRATSSADRRRRSSVAKSSLSGAFRDPSETFPGKCGRDSTRVLRERVYLRYSKDTAGIPAILRVFPGNYPRCIPGVPGIPGIGQIPGDSCGDRPPRFSQLLEEWRFLRPRSPTLLLRFPICFPPALALQGILSVPFYLVAVPASRLRRCRFVIIFCKPVPFLASGGLDFLTCRKTLTFDGKLVFFKKHHQITSKFGGSFFAPEFPFWLAQNPPRNAQKALRRYARNAWDLWDECRRSA